MTIRDEQIQEKCLNIIREYYQEFGIAPNIREIAEALGISKSSIPKVLQKLNDLGYISLSKNIARGIKLNENISDGLVRIPILGTIAAGYPVFSPENYQDTIVISGSMIPQGELFALNVRGESMLGANIFDGDIAIIKKESIVENGQIVAAVIDGETTLKRYYKKGNLIWLMPENSNFTPVVINGSEEEFLILGKLVASLRRY